MELGRQSHNGGWSFGTECRNGSILTIMDGGLLGPNAVMVVYVDPLGIRRIYLSLQFSNYPAYTQMGLSTVLVLCCLQGQNLAPN